MEIIDLNGKKLKVTDLQLAILQADEYRHYTLTDPVGREFTNKQWAYWEDIYQKLLLLEKEE